MDGRCYSPTTSIDNTPYKENTQAMKSRCKSFHSLYLLISPLFDSIFRRPGYKPVPGVLILNPPVYRRRYNNLSSGILILHFAVLAPDSAGTAAVANPGLLGNHIVPEWLCQIFRSIYILSRRNESHYEY